jgi:siroheme synthase-like protein
MSVDSYAVRLHLEGRLVLVAGAGQVAMRKVRRLLPTGAVLHVVAKEALPEIVALAEEKKLSLSLRAVTERDVVGATLVIAATDDATANAALATAARGEGALVLRTDAPEDSDFSVPAQASTPAVEATVSTRGQAPAASRRIACELQAWLAAGPERFVRELTRFREALPKGRDSARRLVALAESDLFEACMRGDEQEIMRVTRDAGGAP